MLPIDMHRPIPTIGRGAETVTAAVTSIVLTVLAMTRAVPTVHADRTEWEAVAIAPTPAQADEFTPTTGGESPWA